MTTKFSQLTRRHMHTQQDMTPYIENLCARQERESEVIAEVEEGHLHGSEIENHDYLGFFDNDNRLHPSHGQERESEVKVKAEIDENHEDWPMTNIETPHENDMILGRGGGTNHHKGNKNYRKMVDDRKYEYVNSNRLDKPIISSQIVSKWRKQKPMGRFIKRNKKTGLWDDVGNKKAIGITSQKLRERGSSQRPQQNEEGQNMTPQAILSNESNGLENNNDGDLFEGSIDQLLSSSMENVVDHVEEILGENDDSVGNATSLGMKRNASHENENYETKPRYVKREALNHRERSATSNRIKNACGFSNTKKDQELTQSDSCLLSPTRMSRESTLDAFISNITSDEDRVTSIDNMLESFRASTNSDFDTNDHCDHNTNTTSISQRGRPRPMSELFRIATEIAQNNDIIDDDIASGDIHDNVDCKDQNDGTLSLSSIPKARQFFPPELDEIEQLKLGFERSLDFLDFPFDDDMYHQDAISEMKICGIGTENNINEKIDDCNQKVAATSVRCGMEGSFENHDQSLNQVAATGINTNFLSQRGLDRFGAEGAPSGLPLPSFSVSHESVMPTFGSIESAIKSTHASVSVSASTNINVNQNALDLLMRSNPEFSTKCDNDGIYYEPRSKLFPWRMHQILDDASSQKFEDIVSWLPSNNGFKVHKRKVFESHIIPKYFKNNTKYKSFIRQLNMWQFERVPSGPNKGSYLHRFFIRDYPDVCKYMRRIKVKGNMVEELERARNKSLSPTNPVPTEPRPLPSSPSPTSSHAATSLSPTSLQLESAKVELERQREEIQIELDTASRKLLDRIILNHI